MGSALVAFMNYLYYPVLARVMRPADYGEVQTAVSLLTQMGIFFQALGLLGVCIITKYPDEEQRTRINNEISRVVFLLSVALVVILALAAPELQKFFRFQSMYPFLALALSLVVNVPLSFSNSYLQGHKKFWTLSFSNLIQSSLRLVFSFVFVLVGLRTLGAVAGVICAQLIALAYSLKMGRGIRHFVSNNLHLRKPNYELIKPEMPFILTVFFTSATTNLLLSLDILFVKHYFPPREAGFYTGISIIANTVYFIAGPMASVLIPSISPSHTKSENFAYLKRSLRLILIIGGLATLIFIFLPHLVITILLGAKFGTYAQYLPGLSIALFVLSISNLLIYYHIGLRHYLIGPIAALGLVASIALLQYRHSTMGAVVGDLEIGALFIIILIALLSLLYKSSDLADRGVA